MAMTKNDVEKRIRGWLSEEGWQLTAETRPEFRFVVIADDGSGRKLIISQHSRKPDRILIEGAISFADDHAKKFAALSAAKRQDFLWDLRFDLLATDVEFSGLAEPLKRITLAQPIFYDALTKDSFMQRVSEVKKALLLVLWKVSRAMEEPPPQMGFIKG
jgi:hypothetical protein